MMGDGVIDLLHIRSRVERAGYAGFHEVEIFPELDWWKRDPDEVLEVVKQRHASCTEYRGRGRRMRCLIQNPEKLANRIRKFLG